jgi:hypothetical protein
MANSGRPEEGAGISMKGEGEKEKCLAKKTRSQQAPEKEKQ